MLQTTDHPPERVLTANLDENGVARSGSLLSLHEGSVRFSPADFPLIGSPEAEVLGVLLADFTCPHCRQLHLLLEEIAIDDPERAAFVVVPAYRDSEAALLHRVLLTAWKENSNVFERFTTSLISGKTDPDPKKVLNEVNTSFGGRFYEIAWNHAPAVEAALELGRQLTAANEATLKVATLPQLMIGAQILSGEPRAETIRALIAEAAAGGPAGPVTPLAAIPPSPFPIPASTSRTSGPKIEFVTTALDLPETVRGETARGAFRYRNTGDATLQITQIKPACGCTAVAGWDQPVPPGAAGSFSVQLDTARFMGNVTKTIDVMSNAVNAVNGVTKVSVTAHIGLPVRLQPSSVNFGTVLKGKPAPQKTLEVTVTDAQPLDIGAPVSSHPAFTAQLEPVEPGRSYRLTVAFTPPEFQIVAQGELTLPLNHPRLHKLSIPLYARIANAVEVIPRDLTLPQAPLAHPQERVLTVQCHDTQHLNFTITGIEISGVEGVTVQLQGGPPMANSSLVRIKVTIPAGMDSAAAAAAGAAVEVKTNHPEAATISVPFKVFERRPVSPVPGRAAQETHRRG
ncbi:MAG TPA: DUF1573 domain-containing protein [Verrucomicrobiales bacterium]|nr:DUF1573 domain-containing protein [Verrucomicrobiales bacterium]